MQYFLVYKQDSEKSPDPTAGEKTQPLRSMHLILTGPQPGGIKAAKTMAWILQHRSPMSYDLWELKKHHLTDSKKPWSNISCQNLLRSTKKRNERAVPGRSYIFA